VHEHAVDPQRVQQVRRVVGLWAERTTALLARPEVEYVLVFENRGREVGATIDHPHGQIYGYPYLRVPVEVAGVAVQANRLVAAAIALAIGVGFYLAMTRTRTGTAVRAIAVDPAAAELVAVDVPKFSALVFAAGGALCAAAGVLISMSQTFTVAAGVIFTMKALVIVIMGGAGNLGGTLVAGLILGLVEVAVTRLVDPGLTLAANFLIFLVVLMVRPTGLFGRSA